MEIVLPFLCFFSVIGLGICAFTGHGVKALPCAALFKIELPLLFLGKLFVGYKFFHTNSPLIDLLYYTAKDRKCQKGQSCSRRILANAVKAEQKQNTDLRIFWHIK